MIVDLSKISRFMLKEFLFVLRYMTGWLLDITHQPEADNVLSA